VTISLQLVQAPFPMPKCLFISTMTHKCDLHVCTLNFHIFILWNVHTCCFLCSSCTLAKSLPQSSLENAMSFSLIHALVSSHILQKSWTLYKMYDVHINMHVITNLCRMPRDFSLEDFNFCNLPHLDNNTYNKSMVRFYNKIILAITTIFM